MSEYIMATAQWGGTLHNKHQSPFFRITEVRRLSPRVKTLTKRLVAFEWKVNETNLDLKKKKIYYLCPSKKKKEKSTECLLLNLYLLADGDVYENKL